MRYYSSLAIVWGAVIAVCFVFAVQTPRAEAQSSTIPPGAAPGVNWADDVSTKEEVFRLNKLWNEPYHPERMRDITTRSARSKLPTVSRGLITRGGLAGAAAGIWIHNGVMLWNVQNCGEVSCPEPLVLDVQFRKAMDSTSGTSLAKGFYNEYDTVNGQQVLTGSFVITGYEIHRRPGTNTWDVQMTGTRNGRARFSNGFRVSFVKADNTYVDGPAVLSTNWTSSSPQTQDYTATGIYTHPSEVSYRATHVGARRNMPETGYIQDPVPIQDNITWTNPIFDWGEATEVQQAPNVTHEVSPQQSTQFANQVGSEGCPVGTAPAVAPAPEVCPDYFPEEWEEEFPDVGQPGEQDDPYSDPDQDGEPNHSDPDDDGDGKNDEDDDAPYVNPSAPEADPDEDGQPNREDEDDDNDGIPDEDDPQPGVPTDPVTLPQDHPYADPDEDGEPNRTDQDDDNDGIPDEADPDPVEENEPESLPNWHPYADPDQDGSRNLEDKDDDQDDSEDWKDRRPFVPSYDPDTDTDEDGVPDDDDPWPGNPHAPADPDADRDQDGAPDYSDPEPENPDSPWGNPENVPDRRDRPSDDPDTPSEATPWQTPSEGNPNVPQNPNNPAYPPGNPGTQNPPDQSTGIENPPPVSSNQPDDPTTEEQNDPPADGSGGGVPPRGPLFACPVDPKNTLIVPPIDFEERFPFSLILGAKGALDSLIGTPQAPTFNLPMLGQQDLSRFDGVMGTMRTVWLILIGFILMPIYFYTLIKGGGE